MFYKLNENAQYFKIIKDTYKDSRKNKQADILFLRGWDVKRGTGKFNKKAYDHDIKSYTKTYKNWQLDENVFEDLKVIKREATAAEVDISVYFSPTSKSLQDLIKLYGHENDFAKIKLDVASIFGITKDFCFENEYTSNLNEYFYDASHSTNKLGLLVIDELAYDKRNEKLVRIIEARP